MNDIENFSAINKRHVAFLVLTFLVTNQFFNLFIVDIHVWRMLNWGYTSCLLLYFLICYISHRIEISLIYKWGTILLFLSVVLCSYVYLSLNTNQTVDQTFRANISWFQFLFVFILAVKEYNREEIFRALTIFSFIWFAAWILGFLSPIPLYDASGEFDEHRLFNEGRGIRRLSVSGAGLMNLWGLWCLSIYVSTHIKKYLYAYFLCLLFVLLCVSRQHIMWYSTVGMLYLLYKSTNIRKLLLIGITYLLVAFVLPQTKIYQKTTELTNKQMKENGGGKNDIRIRAATFFFTEYPQNPYTIFMGHGEGHSHSDYGKFDRDIISRHGFVMADVGFAGLYVKYGIIGFGAILFLFWHFLKSPCVTEDFGLKLWAVYTLLGTIFSHNLDQSMIGIALCLYLLYLDEISINHLITDGQ